MNLPDFSQGLPRAVALDLDGTALNSQSRLSDRTERAVLDVLNAGVPVVIATARPQRVLPVLVGPEIAARCSLVHMSGTAAHGRNPLSGDHRWPLAEGVAEACWEIVTSSPIETRMTIELDGRCFAVSHEGDANELWAFNTATPDMIVSFDDAIAAGPAKVSVNGLGNDLTPIVQALREELDGDSNVVPAVDNSFINVHHIDATKSRGVAALVEPCGMSLSEVLSFGDDYPDLDLVKNTGWPVAVANAIPEVKAAARYSTASNDDDGVAIVLESYLAALRGRS